MTLRISRKNTSTTFRVGDQLCKVTMDPWGEYKPGHWLWNVGFGVGQSRRQVNDWYNKRKNKRTRRINGRIMGRSGVATISRAAQTVLQLRWNIQPGDAIVLDCTSGNPEQQFRAWTRWVRHHPEWVTDKEELKFYWFRPPYAGDLIWQSTREQGLKIVPVTPENPLANTHGIKYFHCFELRPLVPHSLPSNEETTDQLTLAQTKKLIDNERT